MEVVVLGQVEGEQRTRKGEKEKGGGNGEKREKEREGKEEEKRKIFPFYGTYITKNIERKRITKNCNKLGFLTYLDCMVFFLVYSTTYINTW